MKHILNYKTVNDAEERGDDYIVFSVKPGVAYVREINEVWYNPGFPFFQIPFGDSMTNPSSNNIIIYGGGTTAETEAQLFESIGPAGTLFYPKKYGVECISNRFNVSEFLEPYETGDNYAYYTVKKQFGFEFCSYDREAGTKAVVMSDMLFPGDTMACSFTRGTMGECSWHWSWREIRNIIMTQSSENVVKVWGYSGWE